MKLLLHTCCAPCLLCPLGQLRQEGFEPSIFFYNPNIHPLIEYNQRKAAVVFYAKRQDIKAICPDYLPEEFFQAVNFKEKRPQRCSLCWSLRFQKTAEFARDAGFKYFSSTLLVSPYQDHEVLKRIGRDIARETGIEFYYRDFRPGFRMAHQQAKKEGIYCQRYCGCIYSELERCQKSQRH
jgi:predicted adenine nucleotide alpha hydrolase (AANH) superfamily ATPase